MFDPNKAQFSEEELNAARAADNIYETVKGAMADGVQLGDAAVIPAVIPYFIQLYGYMAAGSRAEYAQKMAAIAMLLVRDNDWLNA